MSFPQHFSLSITVSEPFSGEEEWCKKIFTPEITDVFRKCTSGSGRLLWQFALCSPFYLQSIVLWLSLTSGARLSCGLRSHLALECVGLTVLVSFSSQPVLDVNISTRQVKMLVLKCIQVLKKLEVTVQRCSLKKLCLKFSESSQENTCGRVLP